jgi:hypothetical protein
MRMWMIEPRKMCRSHLLGEHRELHAIYGLIIHGSNLDGYIEQNLIEINSLEQRHNEIALEMKRRHYLHTTPLTSKFHLPSKFDGHVNIKESEKELYKRCPECKKLIQKNNYASPR